MIQYHADCASVFRYAADHPWEPIRRLPIPPYTEIPGSLPAPRGHCFDLERPWSPHPEPDERAGASKDVEWDRIIVSHSFSSFLFV
jgi:hypothetical protein